MILKKPYVFLIKHFKFINFLIGLLLIFLSMMTRSIYIFFNNYINDGWYSTFGDLTSEYITINVVIIIIAIIILSLIVILLFKVKKKPILFYSGILILALFTVFVFLLAQSNLAIMENIIIDPKKARFTRDFLLIANIPQFIMAALCFLRSLGFDVKKFNFGEDVEEFDIKLEDDEEFELVVGIDKDRIKRKIKRFIRKSKYIIMENSALLFVGVLVVLIIAGVVVFKTVTIEKIYYKEQETLKINNLNVKVENSYVTSKNYEGDIIDEGYNYIIIGLEIDSYLARNVEFSYDKVVLESNDIGYSEISNKYESFSDIGKKLSDSLIKPEETKKMILVYKIADNISLSNLKLKFNDYKTTYEIQLTPKNLDIKENLVVGELNREILLGKSILRDATLVIRDYGIEKSYIYQYENCNVMDECIDLVEFISPASKSIDHAILKITGLYRKDTTIDSVKKLDDLLDKYADIAYTVGDKEYIIRKLINKTPKNNVEDTAYFEVYDNILDADHIELRILVRNIEYRYKLK